MTTQYFTSIDSPVGKLTLVANDLAIVGVQFGKNTTKKDESPLLTRAKRELDEYFAKKRSRFTLPLEFSGTKLQEKVWKALTEIPFGETRCYADIAKRVGSPRAVRAVGNANGRNPLAIVVPCHRVIGKNGDLTGYGGGLPIKRWLLSHETELG